MITPEKIEEWLKEAEERPASMAVILQYVANRLRNLTTRNEELRAENLALRTDKRVEEYEQRINHLEYQLDLLRRQFGGDLPAEYQPAEKEEGQDRLSVLLYDATGRILRVEVNSAQFNAGKELARLAAPPVLNEDAPRLLVVPSYEELLFVFSSGRIATLAVESISAAKSLEWGHAAQPQEPRGGETLACLAPISSMALADFILQASRRGFVKKLMTSLAPSVLNKHYIGTGATIPGDRTHTLALCGKDDQMVLVSRDGFMLGLDVRDLPFSAEEAFRLGALDGLAAVFVRRPEQPILVMTQVGKIIHWAADRLEISHSLKTRGQSLYSAQRRDRGVRVVGAAAFGEEDWAVALHHDGRLTAHAVRSLIADGAIAVGGELVDFTLVAQAGTRAGRE
jgi:DNA gyrase/topoisomerase IV subunit A